MRRKSPLLLVAAVWCAVAAWALEPPPNPLGRVSDYTDTLTIGEIRQLEHSLSDYEDKTTNQIVVVLIPTLSGDTLEDYSIRLAETWKIGQKGKDNGVILLVVKGDRKVRIEVGYGLEGVLSDSLVGEIIRERIVPEFRQGKFFAGIRDGVSAIIAALLGEYKSEISSLPPEISTSRRISAGSRQTSSDLRFLIPILVLIPFLLLVVTIIQYRCGAFDKITRIGSSRGGAGFSGRGGFGSGGGFSGGGGGFGGGGASRSW